MIKKLLPIALLLLLPKASLAQAAPAAHGGFNDLWVGGQYSTFSPDYYSDRLLGIGFYCGLQFNCTLRR